MRPENSAPVNKMASISIQAQSIDNKFEIKNLDKKIGVMFWKERRPMIPPPKRYDLTGVKFGRMSVVGYLGRGSWQCRCSCGNFTSRRAKAIRNKNNNVDACVECREVAYIKKTYDYIKTGKDKDVKNYY